MADLQLTTPCQAVQAGYHTGALPLGQTPQDQAREIPLSGEGLTARERANVIGINEIWGVADDLDHAQAQFETYARDFEEGRFPRESLYWIAYYLRRLPSICADNRDKLMKAARLMAEANGVRFTECAKGEAWPRGKDIFMCLQHTVANGIDPTAATQEVAHG